MLHPLTTLFTTASTTATCGLILLCCCGRGSNRPLFVWAIAMIVAASGLVVSAVQSGQGGPLESAGTAILICASALFWAATRMFRGAPLKWAIAIAGPAVWMSTTSLQMSNQSWTAASCLIGAGYIAASFREFFLTRRECLPSWLLAVALTFGHAAVYLFRTILAVGEAIAPDQLIAPDWIGVALLIEAAIHVNGTAIVLVALSLERRESQNSGNLRIAAYEDGLTGIANRRRFEERLDELAGDPRQRTGLIGLIMLDLDRFKSVNDTIGHSEGDRILRTVAQLIAANVRPETDLAARFGGEEFAVVIANARLDDLRKTAERIRTAVETAAIPHPGTGGVITVSVGFGVTTAAELTFCRRDFLSQTDNALYEAKRLGRNRVVSGVQRTVDGVSTAPSEPVHAA